MGSIPRPDGTRQHVHLFKIKQPVGRQKPAVPDTNSAVVFHHEGRTRCHYESLEMSIKRGSLCDAREHNIRRLGAETVRNKDRICLLQVWVWGRGYAGETRPTPFPVSRDEDEFMSLNCGFCSPRILPGEACWMDPPFSDYLTPNPVAK